MSTTIQGCSEHHSMEPRAEPSEIRLEDPNGARSCPRVKAATYEAPALRSCPSGSCGHPALSELRTHYRTRRDDCLPAFPRACGVRASARLTAASARFSNSTRAPLWFKSWRGRIRDAFRPLLQSELSHLLMEPQLSLASFSSSPTPTPSVTRAAEPGDRSTRCSGFATRRTRQPGRGTWRASTPEPRLALRPARGPAPPGG
jgi:hypothetical protein